MGDARREAHALIAYARRAVVAQVRAGPLLVVLTVVGVALGVASAVAIQVINGNALAAFGGSVRAVSGGADVTVLGAAPSFGESVLRDVLSEDGVRSAWPLLRRTVEVAGPETLFLEVIGVDLMSPADVPIAGAGAEAGVVDLSSALLMPGWALLPEALALERGWGIGDEVEVTIGTRAATLTVGATVDLEAVAPLASSTVVVMDIAQAQALFGTPGEIDQVDVVAREDADPSELAATLARRLGPGVRVLTPETREDETAGLLSAFRLNLTALSLISVFVGMFLVYSAFEASLVRRRHEFGVLRALGATPSQVRRVMAAEVLVVGLLGVAIGLPVGVLVAQANIDTVSGTLTNLYLLEEIEALVVPSWVYVLGVGVGLAGAFAGAIGPAIEMSQRDTRALLSGYAPASRSNRRAAPLFGAGLGLCGAALAWYALLGRSWQHSGFVLAAAVLGSLPLLTPWLLKRAAAAVRPGDFAWRFSLRSLASSLGTTAVASGALAVAVSMLVGITLMVGSFRETLDTWITTTVRADVFVSAESWRGETDRVGLDPTVLSTILAREDVIAVDRLRNFLGYVDDRSVSVLGVDFGLSVGQARFALLDGSLERARAEGGALVSEPLARKAGVSVGDTISVAGPMGPLLLPVGGVYYDYSSERGAVAMDLETLRAGFGPGEIQSLAIYLREGESAERAVSELQFDLAGLPLLIRSNRSLRDSALGVFDQTFAVTRVLQAMSLMIAAAGIALTLLVVARERAAETALFRSLGATRRQIFGLFLGKGIGIATLGLVLGLLGGVCLAVILIYVTNRAYFGWTIQPSLPIADLLVSIGTILLVSLAASVYPAVRAAGTPGAELSRENT